MLRITVTIGRTNNTWFWGQFEFEAVETIGQSFSNGFQSRFFESPELEECAQSLRAACCFNSASFGSGKESPRNFRSLQLPGLIFEVHTDPMRRRPRPDKTESAGGKTKPKTSQFRKVRSPVLCFLEIDLR